MPRIRWVQGALLAGALFCSVAYAATDCPSGHIDAHARVAHVIDGDTVILTDGRHVRLIGIDTPELGHDGKPTQPFAQAARRALVRLLADSGDRVALRYGRTRHDHYGRTLAHLFLADGASVSAALLRGGYATALVVPPNLWNVACYGQAESVARDGHQGIWALPRYQPVSARALPPGAQGFHIVRGRVAHIGRSRNAQWIDLEGGVALRIDRKDLAYFGDVDFKSLRGAEVIARGWVHSRRGEHIIALRHPRALTILR
ncbi:thermonuclease family protein [Acidihalobacter prosperus]